MNYEAALAFLLNVSVQVALLIVGAYVLILIFRIRDSIIRYGIWLSVLLGCGVLLLFSAIKPPPNVLPLFASAFRVETGGIGRMEGRPEADFRMDSETSKESPKSQSKGDSKVPPFGRGGPGGITEHKKSLPFDFYLILMLLWLSGALWQLVRFGRGSYLLLRLFGRSLQITDPRMKALVEEVAGKIGLRNRVSLRSSSEIDGPVSLGFFKPVVILPRTLAETLSEQELRMILIHELAHIKRLDFVVNLIQSLLDIVLYFHPAFYLLKARLARERESICDDWVVYMTGNRCAYARCLMSIKENGTCSAFGTAIFGLRENLGRRIKMILDERRSFKIQMPRRMLVILVSLACISIPLIATVQPVPSSPEPEPVSPSNIAGMESGGKTVITDPKTGVKYSRTKTLVGKNDVIKQYQAHLWSLSISPKGKFLLWGRGVIVIPLDGGEPFRLVDMPAGSGALSPDGKKVAFHSGGAIWMIPVSPETGRPTGPAKKLRDGKYGIPRWSPDSERIVFSRRDEESLDDIWTLSVKDGTLTQITDDPIYEAWPVWSPDGKTIAYQRGYEIRVIPAEGGTSRKIIESGRPVSWSPDSEWLVYMTGGNFRFFCPADGHELDITPPEEVGTHFAWAPDGKMLFYSSSYDYKSSLKVVPVSGGSSFELGRRLTLWPYTQFWSPDSRMIVTTGKTKDGDWVFWVIPLAGGDPFPLQLDVSVPGKPGPHSLSPDCRKLLFAVERDDETEDLWVVPVSLKDGRTTGPAVMVFSGKDTRGSARWSPDGTKLAVIRKGNIWIVSAEGGEPLQITKTPEGESQLRWSPDGEMIVYMVYHSQKEQPLMVISASGGEPRKLLDARVEYDWYLDGKVLAFFSQGKIWAIAIAGGKTRQILDLKDLAMDEAYGLCWSPDGRHLAFASYNRAPGKAGPGPVFVVPAEGGKATKLATDDPGEKYGVWWSPDGKWISYNSDGMIKTRPEGAIWEADVSELLSGAEREEER